MHANRLVERPQEFGPFAVGDNFLGEAANVQVEGNQVVDGMNFARRPVSAKSRHSGYAGLLLLATFRSASAYSGVGCLVPIAALLRRLPMPAAMCFGSASRMTIEHRCMDVAVRINLQ